MKSVIAQGATVSKAVDEALKKAGSPKEFFIKILQEAQGGFLGFGSTKAKIALFFKKDESFRRDNSLLARGEYKNLFNNKNLQKKAEQQEKVQDAKSAPVHKKPVHKNKPVAKSKQQVPKPSKPKSTGPSPQKKIASNPVRSMKARPLKINSANKGRDGEDKGAQAKLDDGKDPRATHRSSADRKPRQGSRWGTKNRDTVKKNDDKDKPE